MYYVSISVNFITAKYEGNAVRRRSLAKRYRHTSVCISEIHEINLCNYRAQIGLAPHEAALDLLIIVQKRMGRREVRGERECRNGMATIQFICQK